VHPRQPPPHQPSPLLPTRPLVDSAAIASTLTRSLCVGVRGGGSPAIVSAPPCTHTRRLEWRALQQTLCTRRVHRLDTLEARRSPHWSCTRELWHVAERPTIRLFSIAVTTPAGVFLRDPADSPPPRIGVSSARVSYPTAWPRRLGALRHTPPPPPISHQASMPLPMTIKPPRAPAHGHSSTTLAIVIIAAAAVVVAAAPLPSPPPPPKPSPSLYSPSSSSSPPCLPCSLPTDDSCLPTQRTVSVSCSPPSLTVCKGHPQAASRSRLVKDSARRTRPIAIAEPPSCPPRPRLVRPRHCVQKKEASPAPAVDRLPLGRLVGQREPIPS
jgi:hypothetical protein